ncbi:hypothetical protein BHYA_0007g00520 [Botrytis hyacinthi]|uniref:Uncharacterized protein n=1 Tax=Botrytis hyacinthi TaxID=278943 RepID=A0A4Z1H4V9_9HELO|nr:hypothetical protein BHYA_0007g00520 [Botrytis hyacinthi]
MYIIAGFPRDWVKGDVNVETQISNILKLGSFVRVVGGRYPTGIPSLTTKPKVSIQVSSMCPERIFISDEDE